MDLVAKGGFPCTADGAQAPEPLTLLLVEDHRLLRDELASVLNAQSDMVVVAMARDIESSVVAARDTKPRIILMEAALCGASREASRACIARVRNAAPDARMVVTDVPAGSEDMICFVEAGAFGFIMTDASVDLLLATIRSVGSGEKVLPGELAASVFEHIARHASDQRAPAAGRAVRLTAREREVVGLVAQGLSNKEIAGRLGLTTYTIKSHVHNVLEKLALHSRLELAAHAHESQRRFERA